MRVAVVGASIAGVAACRGLHAAGFEGEIVLVGDEACLPYDRPPLSKQILTGAMDEAAIALPALEPGVDARLGTAAVSLDAAERVLSLADGEELAFDGAILATGSRARRLPEQPEADGIHVLRTLDDACAARDRLRSARRAVVIGAGFIGLEAASCACSLGVDVTVLEAASHPMERVLPGGAGRLFERLHRERGVDVRCRAVVEEIVAEEGAVRGVRLAGGEELAADVVVVGVGAAPNVEWLDGSGLEVRDGVVCDASLRAVPGVYACGDIARWQHPLFGEIRVEHWTTAGEHARIAAANVAADLGGAGERVAADSVPYFWSDQHGIKVQMAGWAATADEVHATAEGPRLQVLFGREGQLVAAMTWDWPKRLALERRRIAAGGSWDDAVADAPGEAAAA